MKIEADKDICVFVGKKDNLTYVQALRRVFKDKNKAVLVARGRSIPKLSSVLDTAFSLIFDQSEIHVVQYYWTDDVEDKEGKMIQVSASGILITPMKANQKKTIKA